MLGATRIDIADHLPAPPRAIQLLSCAFSSLWLVFYDQSHRRHEPAAFASPPALFPAKFARSQHQEEELAHFYLDHRQSLVAFDSGGLILASYLHLFASSTTASTTNELAHSRARDTRLLRVEGAAEHLTPWRPVDVCGHCRETPTRSLSSSSELGKCNNL